MDDEVLLLLSLEEDEARGVREDKEGAEAEVESPFVDVAVVGVEAEEGAEVRVEINVCGFPFSL